MYTSAKTRVLLKLGYMNTTMPGSDHVKQSFSTVFIEHESGTQEFGAYSSSSCPVGSNWSWSSPLMWELWVTTLPSMLACEVLVLPGCGAIPTNSKRRNPLAMSG